MVEVCRLPVSSSGHWSTSGWAAVAGRVVSMASLACDGWQAVVAMACWVVDDDVESTAGDAGVVLLGWTEVCVMESSSAMASNTRIHTCRLVSPTL